MKTYYDQRRTYFHNIRFSGVEEERLQERRKKFRFESVSDFIRAAVLDDEIKVVTEVNQDPIRKDYTELIKSTVECIRTLGFRMLRAQKDFQEAIKCPGVDPEFIREHQIHFYHILDKKQFVRPLLVCQFPAKFLLQ